MTLTDVNFVDSYYGDRTEPHYECMNYNCPNSDFYEEPSTCERCGTEVERSQTYCERCDKAIKQIRKGVCQCGGKLVYALPSAIVQVAMSKDLTVSMGFIKDRTLDEAFEMLDAADMEKLDNGYNPVSATTWICTVCRIQYHDDDYDVSY